jgi:hypothetical protein
VRADELHFSHLRGAGTAFVPSRRVGRQLLRVHFELLSRVAFTVPARRQSAHGLSAAFRSILDPSRSVRLSIVARTSGICALEPEQQVAVQPERVANHPEQRATRRAAVARIPKAMQGRRGPSTAVLYWCCEFFGRTTPRSWPRCARVYGRSRTPSSAGPSGSARPRRGRRVGRGAARPRAASVASEDER